VLKSYSIKERFFPYGALTGLSITEIDCVHCAVRTETLTTTHLTFGVSVVEARFRSKINTREILVDKIALGEVCLRVLCFFSVNVNHTHLHQHVPLTRKINGRNLGYFFWPAKEYALFWISNFRRVLSVVCFLLGISPASD
jgi:hypothetical protein